jgi:hypothetical protein
MLENENLKMPFSKFWKCQSGKMPFMEIVAKMKKVPILEKISKCHHFFKNALELRFWLVCLLNFRYFDIRCFLHELFSLNMKKDFH